MPKILMYPNDVLKAVCDPIDFNGDFNVSVLVMDLQLTMSQYAQTRPALGVTAPQLGITKRVFVVDKDVLEIPESIFINPEITYRTDATAVLPESCMSFPDTVSVGDTRHLGVKVKAQDVTGRTFEFLMDGLAAHVMQHEIDHLNGKTLFQNASPKSQKRLMQEIAKDMKRRIRRR